jgi:hypothetical protein
MSYEMSDFKSGFKRNTMLFLLLIIFSFMAASVSAHLRVIPATTDIAICSLPYIPINVTISNVANTYGVQFDLMYNSTVFDFVNISEGGMLSNNGANQVFFNYTVGSGIIQRVIISRTGASSTAGSGVLAKFFFRTKNLTYYPGAASMVLSNVKISNITSVALENDTTGGVVNVLNCTCVEDWSCTDWSSCSGGTKTRTCTDLNNCGTTDNKPSESSVCTSGGGSGGGGGGGGGGGSLSKPSNATNASNTTAGSGSLGTGQTCVPEWNCANWTECASNGQRTRSCADNKKCNSTATMPSVAESCVYAAQNSESQEVKTGAGRNLSGEELITESESESSGSIDLSKGSVWNTIILLLSFAIIIGAAILFIKYESKRISANYSSKASGSSQQEKIKPDQAFSAEQELAAYDYIRNSLLKDYSMSQIRKNLIDAGWSSGKVDEMMRQFR